MRLAGVEIPINKHVVISLTYIYGIGYRSAQYICNSVNIAPNKLTKDLSVEDINKISFFIGKNFIVEGELRKKVSMDIRLLIDVGCYRGRRHYNKLPVHGQRTRTNAKTRKGKSVAIANKKKAK